MSSLLLVAECPGTGKSYLCNIIMMKYKTFKLISPDKFKEKIWDEYGFKNIDEKNKLIEMSWKEYYKTLVSGMRKGNNIISEYPFSDKQKYKLSEFVHKYKYQVVTIRLEADIQVLFERQKERDTDNNRHYGHVSTTYNKNNVYKNRMEANGLLSYEIFEKRCRMRGYDQFELGKLIQIDVNDFKNISYDHLWKELNKSNIS